MAELIPTDHWHDPDSGVGLLASALPDEYVVVVEPTVRERALDAVVVGPRGLLVLYVRDWEGTITPSAHGPWRTELPDGRLSKYPNLAVEARRVARALDAFLKDEFPNLHPQVRHLLVLSRSDAQLTPPPAAAGLEVTRPDGVLDAVLLSAAQADGGLPDAGDRLALGTALWERRLTASQRASAPFVFRSGGRFGRGKRVWTVRAAVRHMDRYPQDGVYHLSDGTLARWLAEQGAEHLARLAGEVPAGRAWDPRARLEHFLLNSGLVKRPRLLVRPRTVNLGHAIPGQTRTTAMRVGKRRGRGYLFGTLEAQERWLRVEPDAFGGARSDVVVSAHTERLPIGRQPGRPGIRIDSTASERPITVPVRLRVVDMPGHFNRRLLRPLAGFTMAGVIGALLGGALAVGALRVPGLAGGGAPSFWGVAAVWAGVAGLAWALLGAVRGALQPPAWPLGYGAGRWILRLLAWAAALLLLAGVGYWAWDQVAPALPGGVRTFDLGMVLLLTLTASVWPATLAEIRAARRGDQDPLSSAWTRVARPIPRAMAGGVLMAVFVAAFPVLSRLWEQYRVEYRVEEAWSSARSRAEARWTEWEADLDEYLDRLVVQRYDRRAPLPPTSVPPAPSPTPLVQGGSDD